MVEKAVDLLIENIIPFLDHLWESVLFWRIISLLLIILFGLLIRYRKKIIELLHSDKIIDHDKNIFLLSDKILNEGELYEILDKLDRLRRYKGSKSEKVISYIMFFQEQGHEYMNKSIRNTFKKFYQHLGELNIFMAKHFFVYPNIQSDDDFQYCLYPRLNPNQEGNEDQ